MILFIAFACLAASTLSARAQSPAAAQQWQSAQTNAGLSIQNARAAVDPEDDDPQDGGVSSFSAEPLLVSPGIYRSAVPNPDSYAKLKALGIKTILSLQDREDAEEERVRAAPFGIEVISVPLSTLRSPTFAQLDSALEVLRRAQRDVLVHCRHGQDRTGVVVATYRVIVEGKSPAEAAEEAQRLHCCHYVTHDLLGLLTRYQAHRLGR